MKKGDRRDGMSPSNEAARIKMFEEAKAEVGDRLDNLPILIDRIKVNNFGKINPSPAFHNEVQIYPVGYKCEQEVTALSALGGTREVKVTCEIVDNEGAPEFRIISHGTVVLASTELEAWKKFDQSSKELKETRSFFNLHIELLIEGLEGSYMCENYRYHTERGYGIEYNDQEASLAAKTKLLTRLEREKRSNQRSRMSLPAEKVKEPKKSQDENVEDKEARMKMRMEERKRASESKRQEREKQKLEEKDKKARQKQEKQRIREQNKMEKKDNQKKHQSILNERRTKEKEALNAVTEYFDREEEEEEESRNKEKGNNGNGDIDEAMTNLDGKEGLNALIENVAPIPQCEENVENFPTFDEILNFTNFLHSFQNVLGIRTPISIELVVEHLKVISGEVIDDDMVIESSEVTPTPNSAAFPPVKEELLDSTTDVATSHETQDASDDKVDDDMEMAVETEQSSEAIEKSASDSNGDAEAKDDIIKSEEKAGSDSSEEAEWEEPVSTNKNNNSNVGRNSVVVVAKKELLEKPVARDRFKEAECFFDLIQLSVIKYLSQDINSFFDIAEREANNKRDRKFNPSRVPLNQLTWMEIARVALINCVCVKLGREKEDIWVKGSKLAPFESQSKTNRFLRQVFGAKIRSASDKTEEETLLEYKHNVSLSPCQEYDSEDKLMNSKYFRYGDDRSCLEAHENFVTDEFADSEEIIETLESYASQANVPETYVRCTRVLIKVLKSISGSFLSDFRNDILDYYSLFRRPISITMVMNSLMNQTYGDPNSPNFYYDVAMNFYRDMRQYIGSAFVYSEKRAFTARAQKLILTLQRHVERWVLAEDRPNISYCDDAHCLWSAAPLTFEVKCARCSACYSFYELQKCLDLTAGEAIIPNADDQQKSLCPLCVKDTGMPIIDNERFFNDDWGPSAIQPWFLNEKYSLVTAESLERFSDVALVMKSLDIVTNRTCSAIAIREKSFMPNWTASQRITVLLGLFEALKVDGNFVKHIENVRDDHFEKLAKNCKAKNFNPKETLQLVEEIAGKKAVTVCKNILDDVEEGTAPYGVCIVCGRSTMDSDPETIVLCDGCNGDSHIECLGLHEIPRGDYYCATCTENDVKKNKGDFDVGNIDNYRSKEIENMLVDAKKYRDSLSDPVCCSICRKSELELCSPLVVGQSRREHDMYVETQIALSHEKKSKKDNSPAPIPYFPPLNSHSGRTLLDIKSELCICHEICALNLFKARLSRSRHAMVRKRKLVYDLTVFASGINNLPLGYDYSGREYWKFSFSDDLFVYTGPKIDRAKREFLESMNSESPMLLDSEDSKVEWRIFSNIGIIRKIVELLGNSSSEASLKRNIQMFVITPKQILTKVEHELQQKIESERAAAAAEAQEALDAESEAANADGMVEDSEKEKVQVKAVVDDKPDRLVLMTNKGPQIPSILTIPYIGIFEDEDELMENTDLEYIDLFIERSRRNVYYNLQLVNRDGKPLKPSIANAVVRACAYRDGIPSPVEHENIASKDKIYYVRKFDFKRPGDYRIVFFLDGKFSNKVKPLELNFKVVAREVDSGPSHALSLLRAKSYIDAPNRQVWVSKRDNLRFLNDISTEIASVKSALLHLYFALPSGGLVLDDSPEHTALFSSGSRTYVDTNAIGGNVMNLISDAKGWNDVLHQAWLGAVQSTNNPVDLMMCTLILQSSIDVNSFDSHSRLMTTLSPPRYAMRSATLTAIAFRIYCIDKTLNYECRELPSRSRREVVPNAQSASSATATSARTARATRNNEEEDGGRTRRNASIVANSRLRNARNEDDDDDDGYGRRSSRRARPSYAEDDDDDEEEEVEVRASKSDSWVCSNCNTSNSNRAHSCENCFHRKPAYSSNADSGRSKTRGNRYKDDDEYNDEDDDNEEEENAGGRSRRRRVISDDEDDAGLRRSSRKRTRPSYGDDDDDDDGYTSKRRVTADEEDDEEVMPSRTSNRRNRINDDAEVLPLNGSSIEFDSLINTQLNALRGAKERFENANGEDLVRLLDFTLRFLWILKSLQENELSQIFWTPVNISNYKKVIRKPMDLGKITKQVLSGFYGTNQQGFAEDVRLVWSNCKRFNGPGYYTNVASTLEKEFESLFSHLFSIHDRPDIETIISGDGDDEEEEEDEEEEDEEEDEEEEEEEEDENKEPEEEEDAEEGDQENAEKDHESKNGNHAEEDEEEEEKEAEF